MPWSVCRMLFESRAEAWEEHKGNKGSSASNDVRYATQEDINSWI